MEPVSATLPRYHPSALALHLGHKPGFMVGLMLALGLALPFWVGFAYAVRELLN